MLEGAALDDVGDGPRPRPPKSLRLSRGGPCSWAVAMPGGSTWRVEFVSVFMWGAGGGRPRWAVIGSLVRGLVASLIALGVSSYAGQARAAAAPVPHIFDAKGVKIRYLVQGDGEPAVLIHGLYSSAELNWQRTGIMRALARDHQAIALDLLGHGGSDRPEGAEAYGLHVVEDVVLLLDVLKVERAHVVGYSLGGMVALKFIATHPDRVISATIGGMGWLREGGRLQEMWGRMPVRQGSRTPAAFVHGISKLALTEGELRAIRAPVIVLVGDRDPVKRLYVSPLRTVRRDWPVVEIRDAGHLNCIVKKQFADEIVTWVAEHTTK